MARFRLERDGALEVYYIPFDWLRPSARIAVVGITPGWTQMRTAYVTVADALRGGATPAKALQLAKRSAAFAGTMRTNLVAMLDQLAVPGHLGLSSSSELWQPTGAHLLQSSSAVRYPVFVRGQDYGGSSPSLTRHPVLAKYLCQELAPELAKIPDALVIPLGKNVDRALACLAAEDMIDGARVLSGFPHPTGGNGHRVAQWEANRAWLKRNVSAWFKAVL